MAKSKAAFKARAHLIETLQYWKASVMNECAPFRDGPERLVDRPGDDPVSESTIADAVVALAEALIAERPER